MHPGNLMALGLVVVACSRLHCRRDVSSEARRLTVYGVYSDHMVIQRSTPLILKGAASPRARITARIDERTVRTRAGSAGNWKVQFDSLAVGGPYTLSISDGDTTITFQDILSGDIWYCAGQSNLHFEAKRDQSWDTVASKASCATVRLLQLIKNVSPTPLCSTRATWVPCTPRTARRFSAVAYYFGRALEQTVGVPVGLIQASWGGTAAEVWMPMSDAIPDSIYSHISYQNDSLQRDYHNRRSIYVTEKRKHRAVLAKVRHARADSGRDQRTMSWSEVNFHDSQWKTMRVPGRIESAGLKIDGAVWLRRTFTVPSVVDSDQWYLCLGEVRNAATVFINSMKAPRRTSRTNKSCTGISSEWIVAGTMLKAENVIAVRLYNQWGPGGFKARDHEMHLRNGAKRINLAGPWKYSIERAFPEDNIPPPPRYPSEPGPVLAGTVYNAMVCPAFFHAIKGIVWYQGEQNASRAETYKLTLEALIGEWRTGWKRPKLPFLIVQLPRYRVPEGKSGHGRWAEIREAQRSCTAIPAVEMAVTLDLGDSDDIHPPAKREVGQRLCAIARRIVYGDTVCVDRFKGCIATLDDDTLVLRILSDRGTSTVHDGPLRGFTVAGQDGVFHPAIAEIRGNRIRVYRDGVANPREARYAWCDDPADANLRDGCGLPCTPFRAPVAFVDSSYTAVTAKGNADPGRGASR